MFVFEDSKRKGSYTAQVPDVYSGRKIKRYFGKNEFKHPKLMAEMWSNITLTNLYGQHRADYIQTVPHYINKMKYGAGVYVSHSRHRSREQFYPTVIFAWREPEKGNHKNRRRSNYLLPTDGDAVTLRRREHEIHLKLAQLRARLAFSMLDPGVLSLDFDLDAPTRGNPTDIKQLLKD